MNQIAFTDFVTPARGASRLDTALGHLGAWFDAEIGNLEDLLDITGHEDAINDIEVLYRLHLNADATPEDVGRLLGGALASLERLLARLRSIPCAGKSAGSDRSSFDIWLCRSGARLRDLVSTLRHALAA